MKKIKHLCVFCGHTYGNDPEYSRQANTLGQLLAQEQITLVYGGGGEGLMGEVGRSVLHHGGEIIGVTTPIIAKKELPLKDTRVVMVDSLQQRKLKMVELSDAFCALPGGVGTLDEVSEVFTLKQLGVCKKPLILLDVHNYWEHWTNMIRSIIHREFADPCHWNLFHVVDSAHNVIETLKAIENGKKLPTIPSKECITNEKRGKKGCNISP